MQWIFAIVIWLIINFITWWLDFYTIICLFVALVIILPTMIKIKFINILNILKNKKLIILNILLNFIILPIIALLIWILIIKNYDLIFGLLLLSLLPWWWLLINWLKKSWADLETWFYLFIINFFIFSLLFIPIWYLAWYIDTNPNNYKDWQCIVEETTKKIDCFWENAVYIYWILAFIILIIFPLIISLIIKKTFLKKLFEIYWNKISNVWTFLVITYIFSLKEIRAILEINENWFRIIFSVILFYLIWFFIITLISKNFEIKIAKAIWRNAYTRFLTIWFVLSSLYVYLWFNSYLTLIFLSAYFIQILSSILIIKLKLWIS